MLDAVNDFILAYAPNTEQNNIFRGYQNRMALPQSQNFIVMSIEDTLRVGTNVNSFAEAVNSQLQTQTLREYLIAIDFCSNDQNKAQEQASTIESICHSYIGVDFFTKHDLSLNYSDNVEYLPYTTMQDEYIHRYRVTLHITKWHTVTVSQEYAERVTLARIENIDAHHKP